MAELDDIPTSGRSGVVIAINLIGGVGTSVGGFLRVRAAEPDVLDIYFGYAIPLLAGAFFGLAAVLWARRGLIEFVKFSSIAVLTLHLMANLGLLLFALPSQEETMRELVVFNFWFPAVFVASFALLTRRYAFILGGAFYALTACMSMAYLLFAQAAQTVDDPEVTSFMRVAMISQFLVGHAMYLTMLSIFSRLRGAVNRSRDMAVKLHRLAHTDGLTGLLNRRALDDVLDGAVGYARAVAQPMALILIDIDHFKSVNDRFGHDVGDTVLKNIAATLRERVRAVDACGRWGGEEFLIILPGCGVEQAAHVAEKLRAAVHGVQSDGGAMSASFGVAALHDDETVDAFVARVDRALYRAKHEGRDRVVSA